MKVATVVGARPQFIKAAILSKALGVAREIDNVLVHTGQHYDGDMSRVFFEELELPTPKHQLNIGSGSHGSQTGRMLQDLERVFEVENPNWVLVLGDTNSTLAGALAAVKLHISVAHVEAGLRSFNRRMPEEINRVLTDHASDLLFPPTELAVKNLRQEGVPPERIRFVGDVTYDAALYYGKAAETYSTVLETLKLRREDYALVTIHRAENTDNPDRLAAIIEGLFLAAKSVQIVFPVHPRTKKKMIEALAFHKTSERVRFIDPVSYKDMVRLEKNARVIATDSGGIQKEAFFYGVPCVTLRDETEWQELVDMGWNRLVPPRSKHVVARAILDAIGSHPVRWQNPYGDGRASERIADTLRLGMHISSSQSPMGNHQLETAR